MLEMLRWAGLAGLVVAVGGSALCGLGIGWALWRQREAEARARRAAKLFAEQRLLRELVPVLRRIDNHDLELELLKAYAAEARRHARPNLSIVRPDEGTGLDVA